MFYKKELPRDHIGRGAFDNSFYVNNTTNG